MNTQNGLPPKNNTESVSYIGGYFNNYIADILHISVRMTLISTYIFGIYVSYLLDNCCFFVCGGHPVCTIIIFVYVLRIIIYKKSIKNQYC